ncbi:MAG: DUF4331 domain-containing protein [Polyangiaceae bacterium]|nr:DUF4331 domain-containing protein [Polyangiaceae bacterium]
MKPTWISAALAAAALTAFAPGAFASSHAEAPGTASDPDVDNTDVWAWRQGNNLVVVAGYNGLQVPYAAPNWRKFSDEVLYEVHVARGPSSLDDAITYQIKFTTTPYPTVDPADLNAPLGGGKEFFAQLSGGGAFNQTYSVTKIEAGQDPVVLINNAKVAPPNVGPRTNQIALGIPAGTTYEQYFVDNAATSVIASLGAGEGRVFAGPRDDPFYVDLGAVFDLAGLRPVLGNGNTARDSVRYTNMLAIALEIPLDVANGGAITEGGGNADQTVGVWASASRRKTTILRKDGTNDTHGPWRQVSRLGLPLINEAVIGLQDKDYWNRLQPKDDLTYFAGYILNPVVVRDAEAVGFYAAGAPLNGCVGLNGGDLNNLKTNRTDIVQVINLGNADITSIGDVLRVDLGVANGAFPNGRSLPANGYDTDVTDIELTLLLCGVQGLLNGVDVPDGVDQAGDITNRASFPYANRPHEGFASGVMAGPSL